MDFKSTSGPTKPEFKFDEKFLEFINQSLNSYSDLIDLLKKISSNPTSAITDDYGICNNGYAIRFIRPHDISTYVSYIVKAVVSNSIHVNINDLELLSASLIKQFIVDNGCVPIENGVIYSKGIEMTDRNQTMDDLVVMCSNEWFETSALSNADMIKRAGTIKEHLAIMEKLNYPPNVRKLLLGIQRVINDNSDIYCDKTAIAVLEEFIKKFILTATAINLLTLKQLIGYCMPNTGYNIKKFNNDPNKRMDYDFYGDNCIRLNDGICTETVDTERYSPVFIVLSKGTTPVISAGLRFFSGGDYSHASISFDKDLNTMYTFNGGNTDDDIYSKQEPGMQKESIHGSKFKDNEVVIYVLYIKKDIVSEMIDTCEEMFEKKEAKYSYKMIVDKLFHRDNAPKDGRFICSSFVNIIIGMCGEKLVDKNIPSPHEMSEKAKVMPDRCLKLYSGKGGDFNFHDAIETIEDFVKEDDSKPFVESYYTECDLLRTNEMRIHSQIPFNCNMRDIVLQDMHPEFKDTVSAIKFMMNDSRSPISRYVKKYATLPFRDDFYGSRILHMFMHYKSTPTINPVGFNRTADEIRNSLGMHTDVNWLDKITYGNNFLDGNYRADAVGNNHFSPIEVTLDTLYKMYTDCGKKSNEDVANNVVTVACAMLDVISSYVADRPDNWDMVRDILAVLGEILTRSMLKLYHNNTMICIVTDDMPDAGGPGYMYEYAMFMEADGPSVEVKVNNSEGTQTKASMNAKTIINKILDFIKRVIGNAANLFNKKHAAEIKWINNNQKLNDQIAEALDKGENGFVINLTNAPNYDIKLDDENKKLPDIKPVIEKYINQGSSGGENAELNFIKECSPAGFREYIQPGDKTQDIANKFKNFIFYGKPEPDSTSTLNGPCKGAYFKSLISNITQCGEAIKTYSADTGKKITDGVNLLKQYADKEIKGSGVVGQKQESMTISLDGELFTEEVTEEQKTNANTIAGWVGNLMNIYSTSFINAMQKQVFAQSYKLYQQIVTGYKQVEANLKPAPQNNTEKPNDAKQAVQDANADADSTGQPEAPASPAPAQAASGDSGSSSMPTINVGSKQ